MEKILNLTHQEIYNYIQTLKQVAEHVDEIGICADYTFNYVIGRNMRNLSMECEDFSKAKTDLIRKYGEYKQSENGGYFEINPNDSNYEAYKSELEPIENMEIEVKMFLVNPDTMMKWNLPSNIQMILWFLVNEDDMINL